MVYMDKEMASKLIDYFKGYKRKTISADEIFSLVKDAEYEDFAHCIKRLIDEDILIPVKSAGLTGRVPRVFSKYRINSPTLRECYIAELERISINLHKNIHLEYYFSSSEFVWYEDKESILKIDKYLKNNGLPKYFAGAPERSYQIFGDEKFITHKKGKRLLERLRLYDSMKITTGYEPAVFFINSNQFLSNRDLHKHVIIENRTTFHALSDVIRESQLTSLIYGAGFGILSSIGEFPNQIDLQHAKHEYFYFGDLDNSGISIWYHAKEKADVKLAVPFYKALLELESAEGKEYQKVDSHALRCFLCNFEPEEQEKIKTILESGRYYPQEAIKESELQEIFLSCFGEKKG